MRHLSIDELFQSKPSSASAPTGYCRSRDPPRISKDLRTKIKIWHRSKSRSMELNPSLHQVVEKEESQDKASDNETAKIASTDLPRSASYDAKILRPEANLSFCLQLRSEGKEVFESLQTISTSGEEDLSLVEGDVLEVISKRRSSNNSILCRNCFGQTGMVPFHLVGPSLFLLPSQVLKIVQQPITEEENSRFRRELERLGSPQFMVKETVVKSLNDTMHLSVNKGDILQLIDPTQFPSRRLKARNCRNYTGYVQSDSIIRICNDQQQFPSEC